MVGVETVGDNRSGATKDSWHDKAHPDGTDINSSAG